MDAKHQLATDKDAERLERLRQETRAGWLEYSATRTRANERFQRAELAAYRQYVRMRAALEESAEAELLKADKIYREKVKPFLDAYKQELWDEWDANVWVGWGI